MKKTVLLIAMAIVAFSAAAQDTIYLLGPKANYYDNYWPFSSGDTVKRAGMAGTEAIRYNTEDTLVIYGIAASLRSSYNAPGEVEVLQLYKHIGNEMQTIGEGLEVCMDFPPTYYMIQNLVITGGIYPPTPNNTSHVWPVYERYFENPVVVTDSFYVGYHPLVGYNIGIGVTGFRYSGVIEYIVPHMVCHPSISQPDKPEWEYRTYYDNIPYIYAILTPPDTTFTSNDTIVFGDTIVVVDTLIVGGDTIITYDTILSVLDNDLNGRLAGVLPNPAAEKARVVSSFGMSLVEVFDLNGAAVLKRRTEGLYTDIDVSRWPTGTYLIRIHTPQGVATKKLVVAR